MEIAVFASNWSYCDRISSYVARMVSHNRTDSLLYANLFSSALNELLETVFREHKADGTFACSVLRSDGVDRIELTVPCDPEQVGFYEAAIRDVWLPNAGDRYREALFHDGPLDPRVGLFELAVDYAARLTVEPTEGNTIRLIADLALEDTQRS